jgi:hypothetical protein
MDITEQFTHAAQRLSTSALKETLFNQSRADFCVELDVGQLVKDPYFTLFEAVGALEVCFDEIHGIWFFGTDNTPRLWIRRWIVVILSQARLWRMNLTLLSHYSLKKL